MLIKVMVNEPIRLGSANEPVVRDGGPQLLVLLAGCRKGDALALVDLPLNAELTPLS